MTTPGAARNRLVTELKRIGPHCMHAVDYLGISLQIVSELPVVNAAGDHALYMLDFPARRLTLACSSEWQVWVGLAAFLSAFLGIDADLYTLCDAAAAMCRRSGLMAITA